MKRQADRIHPRHAGTLLVALLAAAVLLLAGCGQDPSGGGVSVNVQFSGSSAPAGTSSTMATTPLTDPYPGTSASVQMIALGAIVISVPAGTGPGGAFISADANNGTIDATVQQQLQDDAEQSVQFITLVTLPNDSDVVHFVIPPDGAGNWQLVAIGLNRHVDDLASIQSTDPNWFGFIGQFLNGVVEPGGSAGTLTLMPWCAAQGGTVTSGVWGC
ncbi:MAG TPA: hypothetical protein VKB51_11685 [bacterium]|nr:hypothetical protein [bacterium]